MLEKRLDNLEEGIKEVQRWRAEYDESIGRFQSIIEQMEIQIQSIETRRVDQGVLLSRVGFMKKPKNEENTAELSAVKPTI